MGLAGNGWDQTESMTSWLWAGRHSEVRIWGKPWQGEDVRCPASSSRGKCVLRSAASFLRVFCLFSLGLGIL